MASIDEAIERSVKKAFEKPMENLVGRSFNQLLAEFHKGEIVPVVRCRDCKHAQMTYGGECKYCDFWQEDGGDALYLDGDFYCAAGERREEHG